VTPVSRLWSWPLLRLEQLIRLASLLCALVVIGATLSHALQLREAIQTAAESRLQTFARVLAKEVNRSLLQTRLLGESATAVHESLSLRRFSAPWVQALLPFRMPRRRA
jgi:hypothetical protein